jgi:Fn3 associated
MCQTTDGQTPQTNSSTGCAVGNPVSGPISITGTTTLKVVAGGAGYLDSVVLTDVYQFTGTPSANLPSLVL